MAADRRDVWHRISALAERRWLYCAAWSVAVATAAVAVTGVAAGGVPRTEPCGTPNLDNEYAPAPPGSDDLAFGPPTRAFSLRFDDSREPLHRRIRLLVDDGVITPVGLKVRLGAGEALTGPGTHEIQAEGDGLEMNVKVVDEHRVEVCVGINPPSIVDFSPGQYTGSVGVLVGEMAKASVPIEVTFRAWRWKAVFIAFTGVVLGVIVKVLSEAAAIQRSTGVAPTRALRAYAEQLTFPVTLILAAIAGTIVYVDLYNSDRDWGSDGSDSIKLFAACFIVQMSSSEALALLSRLGGGAPGRLSDTAPGTE